PEAVYAFKHALVRDAAYGTLLREGRRLLHRRAAEALERLRAGTAERDPQLLAHHYAQAGLAEPAIRCWIEAAELALARSALAEAEAAPHRALELLPGVTDGTERARLEVDLQLLLARRHMAARGYGAPEAGGALDRALALCDRAEDDDRRSRALAARWTWEQVSGRPGSALALGERLLRDSERRGDAGGMLIGHYGCGTTLLALGRLAEARAHLEAASVIGDRPDAARYALAPGHLVAAAARVFLAAVMLLLGEPERAWAASGEAVEVARRRGDPFTLAFVLCVAARLRLQARDDAPARELLGEARAIADEKGIGFYQNLIRMNAGLLLTREGRPREGAEAIRACIEAHARSGARWQLPMFSAFLAEALAAAGMPAEAARAVGDGLRIADANEDRDSAAELLRLRGCLHEQAGDRAAAEADFEAATALARRQGARLWELRAAAGLARMWRDQGRRAEAYDLLAPVYASFTEGFGLPDLAEARALLGDLDSTAAASPTPL
ncbi:MAG: Adenylate cyclase / Guanylate cyclase, partial [uncultured Acetobacteraceae bacterium]